MSKKDKLIARFRSRPSDFSWDELVSLLNYLGYEEISTGKTAGSRRAFIHHATKQIIRLHKPHPASILKNYQIKDLLDSLNFDKENG